ncbi:MAG TPA: MFS transporter [Chondromyces sp.]|nr:MFS transporter [Chondromyces sp.]
MQAAQRIVEPEKYSTRDRAFWKIIGALICASLISFANLYFVQPMMPLFVRNFSISTAEASLSLSLAVLAMMAGLLLFGFLSDRFGRRRIMDIGLALSILPIILMPFVPSFQLFLVLRIVQGFFIACIPAAAIAYVSEEVAKQSVSIGIMLYIAANGIGGMMGRVFIGYLSDHSGWRFALFGLLAADILLFLLYIWWIAPSRYFVPSQEPFKKDMIGMLTHLKSGLLIPLFLAGIMLQMAFTGVWTYLPFYLHAAPYEWSMKAISLTYFAYVAGVTGSVLAGRLSQNFLKTNLLLIGGAFFLLGTWMTVMGSGVAIVVGLACNCLGFFVTHSLMTAIVNERAKHHKGGASSLYLFSYYFGVAAGGTLTAFIWENIGWMGVVLLSIFIIPFLVWIKISDKKLKPSHPQIRRSN